MESIAKLKSKPPETFDPEITEGKFSAVIGYLSFLCFIPLFLKRGNKFAQFHARQALVLFIFEFVAWILIAVPVAGSVAFRLACLIFGIFSLAGMAKAALNEYWEMPVIHQLAGKIVI